MDNFCTNMSRYSHYIYFLQEESSHISSPKNHTRKIDKNSQVFMNDFQC